MKRLTCTLAVAFLAAMVSAQIQADKLTASTLGPNEEFGQAIAVDDDWLMIGSPYDVWNVTHSGAVFAFQRVGTSWQEAQKLKSSDADFGDLFGASVAIEGSVCVIGAYTEDPGVFAAGSCYVFELTGGAWVQTAKLWASDANSNASFGYSVAISGDRLLIGARQDGWSAYRGGAAYVFDRVGGAWVQSARLQANDAQDFDFFGARVALSGDTALVSSSCDGPFGQPNVGAIYVFERMGAVWTQVTKLYASDGLSQDYVGSGGVTLQQDLAFVAAYDHDHGLTNSGSVYVFERQGGIWAQSQELRCHDPINSQGLGIRIAAKDGSALFGATNDPSSLQKRGTAYAFGQRPSAWIELGKAFANDAADADLLGSGVALTGNTAFVSAIFDDDACPSNPNCNSGAVYVFEIAPDARQYGHCASAAPCGNVDTHGGCDNVTGVGATLAAGGSTSVALDELRMEVRQMQPNTPAIVFMGGGQGQSAFGNGLRVVMTAGGGLYRFGLRLSGNDGAFIHGPGLVAHSQGFASQGNIQPGSIWNFQCWYRDNPGPCAQGTNLTNGVEVIFTP